MIQRRFRLLSLLLCLCLLLAACQKQPQEQDDPLPDPQEDPSNTSAKTLPSRFALPYFQGESLDPVTCADGVQLELSSLLYEGLFYLDESYTVQYALCRSYSFQEDGRTYTFQLRDDALFSDGSAFTAADAAASLQRARSSQRYGSRLENIQSIRAVGNELRIVLRQPNSSLPALLDVPLVKAGSEKQIVPLGTGPYYLLESEDGACLRANPYWRQGAPSLQEITLISAKDNATFSHLFSSHQIQALVSDLSNQDSAKLSGSFDSVDIATSQMLYLGFNTRGIFSDAALRSAVSSGIQRSQIVSAIYSGHAQAAQLPFSPSWALYPQQLESTYSLSAYQLALEELGYTTGKLHRLTLLVNSGDDFRLAAANYIAQALSCDDLAISVQSLPWEEYTAALENGAFDLYLASVRLQPDWDISALVCTGGKLNFGSFYDEALEAALSAYQTSSSGELQNTVLFLSSYFQEAAPFAPICFFNRTLQLQSGVVDTPTLRVERPFSCLSRWVFHLAPAA